MSKLFSVLYLLNDNRDPLRIFNDKLSLSAAIINNAEKRPEGYLVNS